MLPQKALRERGYKGPIFQTHGVASEQFIKLGGADVEGAMFAGESFTIAHDLPDDDPFQQAHRASTSRRTATRTAASRRADFGAHLIDMMVLIEPRRAERR